MGELFAEFGDLVFTLVIGYISAIEFLYVVRHLYHYSFNHDTDGYGADEENLSQLQDSMRQQLADAKNKEAIAGTQVMKDGVPYKDGFRLEAQQAQIDQLKEQLNDKELSELRRQELEKELAKQMKSAERLRKELNEAQAKYERQLKQEEAEKAKKLLEEQQKREKEERANKEAEEQARNLVEAEKQKEAEQRKRKEEELKKKETEEKEKEKQLREEQERKEAEEQARKLAEQEKQREAEQRQREGAEESARKLADAEKQREAEQRQREEEEERERVRREAEENARRLLEVEKQRENEQRQREEQEEQEENERRVLAIEKENEEKQAAEEAETNARNLLAIEHRLEEELRAAEKEAELTENEQQLIESIKKRDLTQDEGNEQKEAELLRKILHAREQLDEESEEEEEEQSLRLIQRERDQEGKQKRIEENALLFMEAEKEMAELQAKMLDAVEKREFVSSLDSVPHSPAIEEPCIKRTLSPLLDAESVHHTVKTQLAQDVNEHYSVSSKTLLFPGVSDDASSIDPASSQQSSFSTQPSEEITTGTDSQYPPQERQEPDGEDTALINLQYSDDYLRSLDGIKQRPLVREDGSGRRRAFKKRRSSNSSNSSRESRHSRDEELKMFTSLEEEEMKDTADSEFTPIRYTSEPTLKVKGHHRRHKRSPAKDVRHCDDSLRSSLERLGEETSNPWGEVKPEHYKHTEFWRREKNVSIDEETEFEKPASSEEVAYDTATNLPSASSFEEASQMQHEEALTAMQKHSSSWTERDQELNDKATAKEETARSDNTNLRTSQTAEKEASPARSSALPRLRRSPLIEEINQYEESSKETNNNTNKSTPTISVIEPLDFGSWRDDHGLMMQGLSDFYDFTASMNPSRSTPTSRNPSPVNTAPNTSLPKDVSFELEISNHKIAERTTVEIYDDTGDLERNEFKKENIIKFIDSINGNAESVENKEKKEDKLSSKAEGVFKQHIQYVADDENRTVTNQASLMPLVNIIDDVAALTNPSDIEVTESPHADINSLVSSLRLEQSGRSRSRSKSPLPTPGNIQRSLENRRYKMIKHNEDILEKLIETKLLPELTYEEELTEQKPTTTTEEDTDKSSREQMDSLVQSLRVDKARSRSKSPMRLPTAENLSKGLEKRRSKLIERNDEFIKQLEERSQTPDSTTITVEYVYEIEGFEETNIDNGNAPTISIESPQNEASVSGPEEDDNCSREKMNILVQSLRAARSRSKSPMPLTTAENVNQTIESTRYYQFQQTEETNVMQHSETLNTPSISIDFAENDTGSRTSPKVANEDCSRKEMDLLVQSLRVARSRSTSKSPMRLPATDTAYEFEKSEKAERSRHSRSKTPSRSKSRSRSHSMPPRPDEIELAAYRSNTPSRSVSPQPDKYDEFHVLLNLEGSENKTLAISSEEYESLILANRQKQLDEEALEKFKYASEEIELRTLSPLIVDNDELSEQHGQDLLADLPLTERAKLLKKSPTTPDYNRTISEEMLDIERIKQERLQKGFKRSTYVGESMDLGSEFEVLRREAAHFQRSHSPSPTYSAIDSKTASKAVEEKRKLQDLILQELTTTSSSSSNEPKETKNTGAIPKTERVTSCEIELTLTNEIEDTIRIKEEMLKSSFQNSTHVVQTVDKTEEYELRKSDSVSRSPVQESQLQELVGIEQQVAKRELEDKMLHEPACSSMNFQDFSRHLNSDFFNQERRASDTALIQKPDILVQLQEDTDLDPEEYHHFRRFSLAQEQQVEHYPTDDYIFIEAVEVRTRSGSRTWIREDFYSEEVDKYLAQSEQSKESAAEVETTESAESEHIEIVENIPAADDDEEYSNASDDDRQTVVEVDDEIDEDISDFNERGPAEESHHETSECEEAEREMDRYAGREASDWNHAVDVNDTFINENPANKTVNSEEDEGAVGGLSNSPYDSDSFAIDQIYDEAIKNRKQSGILREYDSILSQMSGSSDIDEQYLLWSKTQGKRKPKNIEFNTELMDNERKESEIRYLGDANVTARQSARLRSRYGYNPVLQAKCIEDDDVEVDLNYKPKREYNWRKNFKLDEEELKEDKEVTLVDLNIKEHNKADEDKAERQWQEIIDNEQQENKTIDIRKYSLGGESVTLFSRSPERSPICLEQQYVDVEEPENEILKNEEVKAEKLEKPKKKKTKKKLHKETKGSLEETINREDEAVYDHELYNRRSSSIQMENDSPKRKSRSRRSSRSSVTNEDSLGLFSPRSSVSYVEPIADIMEEFTDMPKETARPKKMKKRKKAKETMANVTESPTENKEEELQYNIEPLNDVPAVSTVITPESSNANILSTLSPQNSVCVTPASIDTDINLSVEELRQDFKEETMTTTSSSTTASSPSTNLSRTSSIASTPVDTFDILKDANFYPLF